MPKRLHEWRVDSHSCYKFNNADLALGHRDTTAHLVVFLYLRTTNFPGPDSITRSEQAQQMRLELKATKHERRQWRRRLTQPPASEYTTPAFAGKDSGCSLRDVASPSGVLHCSDLHMPSSGIDEADEGGVARQDHMSDHHVTPSAVTSES